MKLIDFLSKKQQMKLILFLGLFILSTFNCKAQNRRGKKLVNPISCDSIDIFNKFFDKKSWIEDIEGIKGYRSFTFGSLILEGFSKKCIHLYLGIPTKKLTKSDIYIVSSRKNKFSYNTYCELLIYYNDDDIVYDIDSNME